MVARLGPAFLLLLAAAACSGATNVPSNPVVGSIDVSALCTTCELLFDGIKSLLKQNKTETDIDQFVTNLCNALNVEQRFVCDLIPSAFGYELYFVLENTPDIASGQICGLFIKECGDPQNPLAINWTIPIPANKPPVRPWPQPRAGQPTMRILHLSDIHIDLQYAVGSEADCTDDTPLDTYALCCRNYPDSPFEMLSFLATNGSIKVPSGQWGMPYSCDIPYQTFESTLRDAERNGPYDFIIITGDKVAHDCWNYSTAATTAMIERIAASLKQYFPLTPVFEAVGNHEGVPQDAMAPHTMPEYQTRGPQWLYSVLRNTWSTWISDQSALDSIQYRASYAVRPVPGLKLISLNTVYCSEFNFYLYIDQVDPDQTLEWLVAELSDSEQKGEKVYIISHIPAGASYCLRGWAQVFYDIVNRFENTIASQFYGHTHNDHFQVYYENSDPKGRPTHFNWISPSVTTFNWNNPSYRVYTVDGNYTGSSFTVLDADTYWANVTEANVNQYRDLRWQHEYNTRTAYGMADLSPASWNSLIDRLATNRTLFDLFHRYYFRSDYESTSCDADCWRSYVCDLRTAKSYWQSHFCPTN